MARGLSNLGATAHSAPLHGASATAPARERVRGGGARVAALRRGVRPRQALARGGEGAGVRLEICRHRGLRAAAPAGKVLDLEKVTESGFQ